MIVYEPHLPDLQILARDPFKALVAPRPIGWISTVGAAAGAVLVPEDGRLSVSFEIRSSMGRMSAVEPVVVKP